MERVSKSQFAIYSVLAIAVVLVGYRYLHRTPAREGVAKPTKQAAVRIGQGSASSRRLTVHIAGAVGRPGVYRLSGTARVKDAVAAAGRATRNADLNAINLAAKLEDGRQVIVPVKVQAVAPVRGADTSSAGASPAPAGSGAAVAGGSPSQLVNLNTATVEQLDQLDGIGETTAQKIIEYRQQHGGFGSVTDLDKIPGIGAKRIETIRAQASV